MRNRVLLANALQAAKAGAQPPVTNLQTFLHRSQIVVSAGYFDPAKYSKEFLVESKIVQPKEIRKSSRFEHHICQLKTPRYQLLILPPQMQFILNAKSIQNGSLATRKVLRLVKLQKDAPYRSVSMNITWHMWPNDGDLAGLTRRMFGARTNSIHTRFDGNETFFGTYLSAPQFDGRLRLDVKPVEANSADGTELHLSFAFNFGCDLPSEGSYDVLRKHLGLWDKAFRMTEKVMTDMRRQFGASEPPAPQKPR